MWSFLKKHYHWVIAAMALLQLLIYGGAVNNFSGYHMIPVSEALGISRTAFSLSNSVRAVMGVVSTLFSGTLIHRYGYRKMAAIGLCVGGLAYAVYMSMNSYWMLVIGACAPRQQPAVCSTAGSGNTVARFWAWLQLPPVWAVPCWDFLRLGPSRMYPGGCPLASWRD